ncbi:MAG TPA: plastocyanin/azurin family copper-binding protein [Acidimicrobiales bacterium]|nr:plastocyanin/azurin family copper-binding protein [Acidimicrobiales bacterium]
MGLRGREIVMRRVLLVTAAVVGLLGTVVPSAGAVHFYRGTGQGCSAADGALGAAVTPAATVMLGHNTYHDPATGFLPVTVINAGEAVQWTWNSAHCHSVNGSGFASGFHYPASTPTTPAVAPGALHYPVPEVAPTLSYTRTFPTAGTFQYSCVHHAAIGMAGIVVVQ